MKNKKYWAGFCDNKIAGIMEKYGNNRMVLAIYLRKKDAQSNFQDVRAVEIRELN